MIVVYVTDLAPTSMTGPSIGADVGAERAPEAR
jgi:hypothetical protein